MTAAATRLITTAATTRDADNDGFLTVAELAALTGRTARSLRRSFRKAGNEVGHGSVWAIPVTEAHLYV